MGVAAPRIPERVQWAIDLLDVRPADHILEIGCGAGHAVSRIAERLTRGTITAIDRSPVAVARARERNHGWITARRARIECLTLEDAEPGRRFSKIFSVNVNAFWTTPDRSLGSLARLLAPDGVAWLVYEPPSASRLRDIRSSLVRDLEAHRFSVQRVETQRFRSGPGLAILGQLR